MSNKRDVTGQKFGRLTAIHPTTSSDQGWSWLFRCDCGETLIARLGHVVHGATQSCGCLFLERLKMRNLTLGTHRMTNSVEYKAYWSAKQRCENSNDKDYHNYGARGIRFLFSSFEQWYSELGLRPSSKHSIDRIENDLHYGPGNVRWATLSQQHRNTRRSIPDWKIREIKTWLSDGFGVSHLARIYGVSASSISMIHTGKMYGAIQ